MYEWLQHYGWELFGGHDEGQVFCTPELYIAIYHGDGVWHLFDRYDGATYDWRTAKARGCGLAQLQLALTPAPKEPLHNRTLLPA